MHACLNACDFMLSGNARFMHACLNASENRVSFYFLDISESVEFEFEYLRLWCMHGCVSVKVDKVHKLYKRFYIKVDKVEFLYKRFYI